MSEMLSLKHLHGQNSWIDSSSKKHTNSKLTVEACLTSLSVFGEMQIKIKRNFVTVDNGQL